MSLPIQLGATSGSPSGYKIQRSLRLRSSASAYLSRTFGSAPTSNQKATISIWFKLGSLSTGAAQVIYGAYDGVSGSACQIQFNTNNTLTVGAGGTANSTLTTNAVYRDPSAWYHLVVAIDTTQATAANRQVMWLNGSQITSYSTANYPVLNGYIDFMYQTTNYIGQVRTNAQYFDGYLAEVNFIDGQALTPSSFGQTDAVTGVWTPKKYTGTYGTNGFYLPFSDNTSATTLAYDKSGNGNNWTPNNISTTAGATYDSMTDVPTLTSGTAANFATLNPINTNAANSATSSGNLNFSVTSASGFGSPSTFLMSSGKWYFEMTAGTTSTRYPVVGVQVDQTPFNSSAGFPGAYTTNGFGYGADGNSFTNNGPQVAFGSSFTSGDVIGVAVDVDAGKVWMSKNGTWQASGNPSAGTSPAYTITAGTPLYGCVGSVNSAGTHSMNFGQRPFSYTPPTGFKALNTFNLPDPTIKKPNQYMDATTYTGNGSTNVITNAGGFQPDLVWTKGRSVGYYHQLYDSVRGVNRALYSNVTDAEFLDTNALMSFDSGGWTMGAEAGCNNNGTTYVGWQWKKGATPGFDIVTYTGNGTAGRTVSHSLGVAPAMVIVKERGNVNGWYVYHTSLGNTKCVYLDSTSGQAIVPIWNNTTPTASVITFNNGVEVNRNGGTYVAYLFAEIPGFSKFGSYTGNGSTDGPFVYCGFRPKYILVKSSSIADWFIFDSSRNTYNVVSNYLLADNSAQEAAPSGYFDFTSNGFKLRSSVGDLNVSGGTYIYACFSENPFKYSLAR